MDAISPDAAAAADRRLSVARLAAALRPTLAGGPAEALWLPLCFLFARHLRFDCADPLWPDRDRLVLDGGLEPLGGTLAELAGLPREALNPPGPAFGTAVGLALAERLLAARFGRSLVDHRSWIIASADNLATGGVAEAAFLAGAWRLSRLTAIVAVPSADAPGLAGFAAAGWSVRRIDADAAPDVAAAISAALRAQRPTLIACVPPPRHPSAAFGIAGPVEESILAWRSTGKRSAGVRRAWLKRLARHGSRADFDNAAAGRLPHGWYAAFFDPGALLPPGEAAISTSWTLRRAINRLAAAVPDIARLPVDAGARQPGAPAEPAADATGALAQGLSGVAAGIALHGGVVPVSRHRLEDAGQIGDALRAAAASGLRTLTLLTEPEAACPAGGRRAGLRAIPNLCIFRPADASEALECAELGLRRSTGPSVVLVSEAPAPLLADRPSRTRCAKGGYVIAEAAAPRVATLIAGGPELHVAMAARDLLWDARVPVAVVSLPCWSFFARQESVWQEAVLGDAPRIGIEAGGGFGWDRWLGLRGLFIGCEQMAEAGWSARRAADLVLRHLGAIALD